MSRLFLAVCALALASFAASPVQADGSRHALGPVYIGMTHDQVQALGIATNHITQDVGGGDTVVREHLAIGGGQAVDAIFQDGVVISLATVSPNFVALGGGHVGVTLAELRGLYPHGHFYWGQNPDAGPFMNYDAGGGLSFAFNTDNLRPECLEQRRRCPSDFEGKRVIMVVMR